VVAGPAGPPALLSVVPAGDAGFGIQRVWPNPARASFQVMLEVPDATPATLEVMDVAGRLIEKVGIGVGGPARGTVRLGTSHALDPGVYWIRLRQGPLAASQRIIAIR